MTPHIALLAICGATTTFEQRTRARHRRHPSTSSSVQNDFDFTFKHRVNTYDEINIHMYEYVCIQMRFVSNLCVITKTCSDFGRSSSNEFYTKATHKSTPVCFAFCVLAKKYSVTYWRVNILKLFSFRNFIKFGRSVLKNISKCHPLH